MEISSYVSPLEQDFSRAKSPMVGEVLDYGHQKLRNVLNETLTSGGPSSEPRSSEPGGP